MHIHEGGGKFSAYCLLAGYLLMVSWTLWYQKWTLPYTEATISWDVSGYYLYLPATFIYKDLEKLAFFEEILNSYGPSVGFGQAYEHESGNYVLKYSMGQAVLYAPAFFLAHGAAKVFGYPADGFSVPYQFAISWWSVLVAFFGLFLLRQSLRGFFDDRITGCTLLVLVFATNYLNYASIDGALSHNYLFTLYALLIWLLIRWYERPNVWLSLGIGFCIGLAALTRPTEIVLILLALSWGAWRGRWRFWMQHLQQIGIIALFIALIGFMQLLYWKTVGDSWLIYSYQDEGFQFLKPHIESVLFSYRKGWLVYTPAMIVGVLGFFFLFRQHPRIAPGLLLFFLINFWIVASWDIWWYGGSYGQRALVQSYVVMAFPVAAFLRAVSKFWWAALPVALFLLGCTIVNQFHTYQAHRPNMLHADLMTKAYYWRIFLNTKVTDQDQFLLDTDEDYRGLRKEVEVLAMQNFDPGADSSFVVDSTLIDSIFYSSPYATFVSPERQSSRSLSYKPGVAGLSKQWIRVRAQFYSPERLYSIWRMPMFYVQFLKDGKWVKGRMIKVNRLLDKKQWQEFYLDIRVPEQNFDEIRVFLDHPRKSGTLIVDDIVLEAFNEE